MTPEESKILSEGFDRYVASYRKWEAYKESYWQARNQLGNQTKENADSVERNLKFTELDIENQIGYLEFLQARSKYLELIKNLGFTFVRPYRFFGYTIGRLEDGIMKKYEIYDDSLVKP